MVNALKKKECCTGHCQSEYLKLRAVLELGKPALQREEHIEKIPETEGLVIARGLCMNCDDRHLCKYPSFGKNVIYCESYI